MDFFSSVKAKYHVVHFTVGEFDHFVVQQHPVCGEGEPETLAALFFPLPRVGDGLFDDLPVHERLPAEEVHFQVGSAAGMRDQKIDRLFPHGKRHEGPFPVILSLAGETVFAV
ncbi:hypothetical protein SDC9_78505 [bioreactor metagenome]|uniref:Uncharacterized protein n=1 Tax=bioreactor metagenome TaxID=1076179 RepID=A0A644YVC6_9ZZZZ